MRVLGALGLCALAAVAARADVVSAEGRPIAVNVQITALRDGQLFYRLANGQEISRGVEQIRYLQVSGWETFNQAEKQQREGQGKLAIGSYEQCLGELGTAAAAPGAIDRGLLVQCRLVRLYDAQGQFDLAVAAYLAVIEKMPAAVDSLRPARLPKGDPQVLRKAAQLVDEAIGRRDRLDKVAVSLEKWRATWPEVEGGKSESGASLPGAAPGLVPRIATRPSASEAAVAPIVAEIRSLVEKGKFEQAVARVDATKNQRDPFFGSAELHYWHGRARLGMAGAKKGVEAQVERRRAGLAFMRVVIHWPESPLAAECLYRAGEMCRENGQMERAAALWTDLLVTYPNGAPWARQARDGLGRVRATATGPAK